MKDLEDLGFIKIDRSEEVRYQYFYWKSEDFLEVDFSKLDDDVSIELYKANDDGTHNSVTLLKGEVKESVLYLLLYELTLNNTHI